MPPIEQVFVYGTLQRGQVREPLWPCTPSEIRSAWTRGRLYHRHDYPAMLPGSDRVVGELWRFSAGEMPKVLKVLDEIEGVGQPGEADLYRRVAVETFAAETFAAEGRTLGVAFAYHYARSPVADGFVPVEPSAADDTVAWKPD